MATSFYSELNALNRAKNIISILPQRARFRVAKKMYDYQSSKIFGIDLVVPLQQDGLVCFINTKDIIGWTIFFTGEYEKGTNKILAAHIKAGDTVIEAGANIGSETLIISKLVGNGCVYGFEPNPYSFERLGINVSINNLTNVKILDIAMGEKDGDISFNIYPKNFCNPGMSSKYEETPITRKITVPQQTLDTFVAAQKIGKVDFIKMDIQGAEMDMLKGATDTIARDKPKIFLEATTGYNDINVLYNELKKYNYNIYVIGASDMKLMKSLADAVDGNWLAMQE